MFDPVIGYMLFEWNLKKENKRCWGILSLEREGQVRGKGMESGEELIERRANEYYCRYVLLDLLV